MQNKTRVAAGLFALAACQQPQEQSRETKVEAPRSLNTVVSRAAGDERLPDEVGLYRWSSGVQMGQFWAAVLNKKQDTLRFFADAEAEGSTPWEPDVELADATKLPPDGGLINLVVGQQSVTFQYRVSDGQPNIELLGTDGWSSAARAVEIIRGASGQPVCLEFPEANYVSCFSTRGADQVFRD